MQNAWSVLGLMKLPPNLFLVNEQGKSFVLKIIYLSGQVSVGKCSPVETHEAGLYIKSSL